MKTVREWKIALSKIKDVEQIEKHLKEENALPKPRKGVIDLLEAKIELLTIKPIKVSENQVRLASTDEGKLSVIEKPTTVVLHQEKDFLLILEPYKDKLKNVDLKELVCNGVDDKIGYQKIKNTLSALLKLRQSVDAEKKTFNAPYTAVVSFSNESTSNLIGEIKDVEKTLKERKKEFDDELVRIKEEATQKKAIALAAKQKAEEEAIIEKKRIEQETIHTSSFQERFGGIIGRASANSVTEKVEDDDPFADNSSPDLFSSKSTAPIILTDKQILAKKMSLLNEILELESPDAESFIKPCKVIDSNVLKIVKHIKSNYGV